MAASHAIYEERIYTLNDHFTVEKWASEKALKLAQELKCGGHQNRHRLKQGDPPRSP